MKNILKSWFLPHKTLEDEIQSIRCHPENLEDFLQKDSEGYMWMRDDIIRMLAKEVVELKNVSKLEKTK